MAIRSQKEKGEMRGKINMNAKLKYSKVLRVLLLLTGYWCLNRFINRFTLDWNQLAFAVPVTVINLIVSRCSCYHETDHFVSVLYVPSTIGLSQIPY